MASRAPKPCRAPGCASISQDGSGYCDGHKAPTGWTKYSKESRHKRGYGSAWSNRIRPGILRRDKYLCQPCLQGGVLTDASQVDHIIPKSQGGTDSPDNLQSICASCHRLKTQAESKGATGCDVNGRPLDPSHHWNQEGG